MNVSDQSVIGFKNFVCVLHSPYIYPGYQEFTQIVNHYLEIKPFHFSNPYKQFGGLKIVSNWQAEPTTSLLNSNGKYCVWLLLSILCAFWCNVPEATQNMDGEINENKNCLFIFLSPTLTYVFIKIIYKSSHKYIVEVFGQGQCQYQDNIKATRCYWCRVTWSVWDLY